MSPWTRRWQAWRADARRILALAGPVFVGQLAVLAFSTIDTVLVARTSAQDLAALAVASAAYITTFVGLMGVLMAISPIVAQMIGAGRDGECGLQFRQAAWLALFIAIPGCALLLWPEPFLALSQAGADVEPRIRGYLRALAGALPAVLLFTVFRGFCTAVSQPRIVMRLQLIGLAIKVPLTVAFVFGLGTPGEALHLPAQGVVGCGIATVIAMWCQAALAAWALRHDAVFTRFGLNRGGLGRPDWAVLRTHLRLGIPMGLSIFIEVTGFSFMAIFISRLGTTAVAGHQIAINLVSLMFMLPLALANATGTLVAQGVGAGETGQARAMGWHGLALGALFAVVLATAVFVGRPLILQIYTNDPAVILAAASLLTWVILFHLMDALQTIAAFVLRAWHVATVPMLIYAVAIWGVGLGGGYALALHGAWPAFNGAIGFWAAATAGLSLASLALLAWLLRLQRQAQVPVGNVRTN